MSITSIKHIYLFCYIFQTYQPVKLNIKCWKEENIKLKVNLPNSVNDTVTVDREHQGVSPIGQEMYVILPFL